MRADEERIARMHQRAKQLQYQKKAGAWGSVSLGLILCFLTAIAKTGIFRSSSGYSGLTGSFLMGEDTGGYVLVGVISFVFAVLITVYLMRKNRGNKPE